MCVPQVTFLPTRTYEYLNEAAVSVITANIASRAQPDVNANSDYDRCSLIRIIENLVDGLRCTPGISAWLLCLLGSWRR